MTSMANDPVFRRYFKDADYTDVKSVTADVSLREFISGMLTYDPWWLVMLYRIREILVTALGLVRHARPETLPALQPAEIPFAPGDKASFFIVHQAQEDRFWVAEAPADNHLGAYFGIVASPLGGGRNRFTVFTAVRFHNWSGPVYFNLIRPFHHLVVASMMRAGSRRKTQNDHRGPQSDGGCTLIDRFSLKERLFLRVGGYGFMVVGTWGIYRQAPVWAAIYVVFSLLAFGLSILPGLCAHCPYPSRFGTCLFLPPVLLNRLFPYKGPRMSAMEKLAVSAAMASVVLLPQLWLVRDFPLLVLFWLLALPVLAAFPRHYCRRCRHFGCPMNRAGDASMRQADRFHGAA